MATKRVYVAFDYDDLDVKENLIVQSQRDDCPFTLVDRSIPREVPSGWTEVARERIASCECVIVLCGEQTHQAEGVAIELQFAQQLKKPYFLLQGTRRGTPTRPRHARATDRIWAFRWPTVTTLLEGRTPPDDTGW